ncbi:hypothetical protein J5N97_028474 [Dioscorea zingiberensis]|uniref:Glycine-rich protein n=1 Tax=Dioscorea zingiberensis TaxID=325984 RepID=A0A9D5BYI7_9LILI|nr:hypothetical protein J5N97_028474 [Dioscorea zingiberensis]
MKIISILSLLLLYFLLATSTRELTADPGKSTSKNHNKGDGANFGFGNIPGFNGDGWGNIGGGYGAGYGGSGGGYSRHGVIKPSVVCTERGPCYNKRVTCPAKCFTSYSHSGKNGGGGGGGGGCTIDCKKHCIGYC